MANATIDVIDHNEINIRNNMMIEKLILLALIKKFQGVKKCMKNLNVTNAEPAF